MAQQRGFCWLLSYWILTHTLNLCTEANSKAEHQRRYQSLFIHGHSKGLCITASLVHHVMGSVMGNSCADRCDEAYFPGKPCYCNEACAQYENCCFDYAAECNPNLVNNDTWIEYNEHVYKYTQQLQVTVTEAILECRQHGALLVSINTKAEFEFIHSEVLRGRPLSAFIGGTDAQEEGTWRWSDGTAMALPTDRWHAWYTGEPNNANNAEDCSVMTNYEYWVANVRKETLDAYVWRDYSCDINAANEIQGYICEGSALCEDNPCENGGTCYYVGGEPEFECVCPQNYLGEFCQYEAKEGEVWRECGETQLTAEEGVISSPLYPKPYPNNVRCNWYITGEPGRTMSFSVDDVEIEVSKHCRLDFLAIYDGHLANQSTPLFGPYCGDMDTESAWPVSDVYTTSSHQALVVFNTDEDVTRSGFRLAYKQEKCGQGEGQSGCATRRSFRAECGEITVEESLESWCDWQILIGNNRTINLTFTQFHLRDGGIQCSEASLEIYEGQDTAGNLIGRYCGQRASFSVLSSTNQIYMKLTNSSLLNGGKLDIQYTTYDIASYSFVSTPVLVEGSPAAFFLDPDHVQIQRGVEVEYQWHLKVKPGHHLTLDWQLIGEANVTIKMYQGLTEELAVFSQTFTHMYSENETFTIPYFQATVKLVCVSQTNCPLFEGVIRETAWETDVSHCFRPAHFSSIDSPSTENHLITTLQPLILAVADNFYSENNAFYPASAYCKWKIRADEETGNVSLTVLDANVFPVTDECDYDGLVIYDGPDTASPVIEQGPLCGADFLQGQTFEATQSELLVVFYSDPGFGDRKAGKLRVLAHKDPGECSLDQMSEPSSVTKQSSCGTILSPNFPGLVQPGMWFWIYQAPDNYHFSINVHYVRGPAVDDPDCKQSFKVIEISKDSTNLRLYEFELLELCGDTDLFIPPAPIQVPPHQKFGLELNTISNALLNRWEFKLSYTVSIMTPPRQYPVTGACPADYVEWRGHCYHYYQWVRRHYQPEEYAWQQSWQKSLEKCEAENATLVSVYDEEEAEFIKYEFSHTWFWDPAAPYVINHRLLYIGLHNTDGQYVWTSGPSLGYADWYRPGPAWDIAPVFADSILPEIVNLNVIQPSADVGSLCTAMMINSPFKSMKWVKIPCDYPIHKVGTICKKPLTGSLSWVHDSESGAEEILLQSDKPYKGCPESWFLMGDLCYKLLTNYKHGENGEYSVESLSVDQAQLKCQENGGRVDLTQRVPPQLYTYLRVWNHTEDYGGILVGTDPNYGQCLIVQPLPKNLPEYQASSVECNTTEELNIASVLCIRATTVVMESCGANEFRCDNQVCVSVDSVCDSHNDCMDNSDEIHCACGETMFECQNSQCISLSLRCDFVDHCGDFSDEQNCKRCDITQFQCDNGECIDLERVCDFKYDCVDQSDEAQYICGDQCNGFQCYSGMCIDEKLRQDGIGDCPGLLLEDETKKKVLKTLFEVGPDGVNGENETDPFGCGESASHVNCRRDISDCYERSHTCVYDTEVVDEARTQIVQSTCRDGSHLRKHCDSIECPGMYHCPGSYCIPYRKVCDGNQDCPLGHDEMDCHNYVCPGLFKCKGTGICLPHSEVCDGVNQCEVHHEDEKYCSSEDVVCDYCSCLGQIADCTNNSLSSLPIYDQNVTRSLRGLFLSHNELTVHTESFIKMHWLSALNLSHNNLEELPEFVFRDLVNLLDLDLSVNLLRDIRMEMFYGLVNLRKLDLSSNRLTILTETSLNRLMNIEHLIIENNPSLLDVDTDSFSQLMKLRTLNSDAYMFCCIAKQVDTCTPEADAFSNCEDLMANYPLQISIWILGITAAVGNLFVLIWRLTTDRQKASSLFIINLGCSDLLMGIYLLIIAAVDVHYRGRYILHAHMWRSSSLCQIAGVLSMLSSEMSVFMLSTITVDRCLSIIFPLKFTKLRLKHARTIIITGWVVCFILSVIPVVKGSYFGDAFFGRTGVCLPLIVSNEKLPGWEYSVFIFLVLNFLSFLLIFIGYAAIFMSVKTSIQSMGDKASTTADEYSLAKKLMVIVATDFVCWVPIILIGFSALGGAVIPPQVSAWIAVFILPLNSAVNPLLYTVSAIDCSKKKNKKKALYSHSTKMSSVSVRENGKISMETVTSGGKKQT